MLGDSLTAGYGLAADEALPVRLQTELAALGCLVTIRNAGVSGDTVRDGMRRVDRDVPGDTQLCIVALGANDMMLKRPVEQVRTDLDALLARLSARSIPVLVCGMRAPPWMGPYAPRFDAIFAAAATQHGAAFDPFLLEGIALNPLYALRDRIHPNAAGIAIVAHRLAPHVAAALADLSRDADAPSTR